MVIFITAFKYTNENRACIGINACMVEFDEKYWTTRWKNAETGWDIGYASTPLKNYINQLTDKNLKILIPGAGNAWEGILLHELGFTNTYILDISAEPLANIQALHPAIPADRLVKDDFFTHTSQYDSILEQTFFCALHPSQRRDYFKQCSALLKPGGKLVGVVFHDELNNDHPPFGGKADEYQTLFDEFFTIKTYQPCVNSIKPRMGREWFMILIKKD